MSFCSAEKCALCSFIEGSVECLRNQARRYLLLAKMVNSGGLRDALSELGSDLMNGAATMRAKEPTALRDRPLGGA